MIIKKNSTFALVGHGLSLIHLYNELVKNKLNQPIIITHKKKYHLRDIKQNLKYKSIYKSLSVLKKKVKIFYVDNFNLETVRSILKKNKIDYIFSCSSRFIFKKDVIEVYKNKIFNIHGSFLPEYRAGSYTIRIFNSDYYCASTIHTIDKGIDAGKTILQSKKVKVKISSLPHDFLLKTSNISLALIKKFVKNIRLEKKFNLKKQNEKNSTYYSRFYTEVMGAINWDWNALFINQFIKGCSKPYSGAFCFIIFKNKKYKVKIFNSKYQKSKKFNHPALNGKIFFQNKKLIKISAIDGYISVNIKDISFEKKIKINKFIGKTFFNSYKDLEKAKILIPNPFKYK